MTPQTIRPAKPRSNAGGRFLARQQSLPGGSALLQSPRPYRATPLIPTVKTLAESIPAEAKVRSAREKIPPEENNRRQAEFSASIKAKKAAARAAILAGQQKARANKPPTAIMILAYREWIENGWHAGVPGDIAKGWL